MDQKQNQKTSSKTGATTYSNLAKSTLDNVSALERKLNIEVPAKEVQDAFDRAFSGIQRSVEIKGFRKGKAPLATIKSLYADRVKQDVIQDIVQSKYAKALKEHSLDPISYPAIEFDPVEDGKDFAFTAEFEVRPEVTLKQVDGLPVKREKFEMNDALVDATIEDIRKGRAETAPVLEDRGAAEGDVAVIDFKGMVDGAPLENGAAEGHQLELGAKQFIPGFEEGVLGMKPGQSKKISIKFPDDYHVAELKGKPVEFETTLKELKKRVLPGVDDEFAKSVGPYADLKALRDAIRLDFEQREGKRVADDLKNRLMKVLVDRNPVAVPKSLLNEQKKALIEDMEKRMEQQGLGAEQYNEYKEKWDKDFAETASYMIQSSFLIDKIAAENKLKATAADLDRKMVEFAAQSGIEMERVHEFYGDQERRSRLTYQVTEEKVLDFLISKSKITDVSKEEIAKDEPPTSAN
jgi:trigger factor